MNMNKGRWITSRSRLVQSTEDLYELIDNELYEDTDGTLYIAPRGTITDNFSRPFGNKQKYDVRPSHIHDIGCRYKQLIKITVSVDTLVTAAYLQQRTRENLKDGSFEKLIVLEDVRLDWLEIVDVGKTALDNLFYRMCIASDMPKCIAAIYRAGVFCNVGWLWSGQDKITLNNIFIGI